MDASSITKALAAQGMPAAVAAEKTAMFTKALARLPAADATSDADGTPSLYWVPGRVEVAGKHTDYAGGRSLLAAISKGFGGRADEERCDGANQLYFIYFPNII